MRHLEEMLKQERRARETAEERARHMQERSRFMQAAMERTPQVRQDTFPATAEQKEAGANPSPTNLSPDVASTSHGLAEAPAAPPNGTPTGDAAAAMDASAQRIAHLVTEMDTLRGEMESHKHRAESAEKENLTLLEKVQRIRQEERAQAAVEAAAAAAAATTAAAATAATASRGASAGAGEAGLKKRRSTEMATQTDARADAASDGGSTLIDGAESGGTRSGDGRPTEQAKALQDAVAQALARHGDGRLTQSAPYASMLGVVLIGVGLMAYLNGWNKVER